MNIILTIHINNKQGVWLSIVDFFKLMDCHLEIKNILEQGEERIITVAVIAQKTFTVDDMRRLEDYSDDVLSVQEKIEHDLLATANTAKSSTTATVVEKIPEKKTETSKPEIIENKEKQLVAPELPLPKSEQQISSPPPKGSLKLIVLAVIVLIAIGSYFGFQQFGNNQSSQAVTTDIVQQQVDVNDSEVQTGSVPEKSELTPLPTSIAIATDLEQKAEAEAASQQRAQIATLLTAAEKTISTSNLTELSIAQALQSYQEILRLNPDNQGAKLGFEQVVKAHIDLSDQAIAANNFDQAQQLLQQAESVSPQNVLIAQARQGLLVQQLESQALTEKSNKIATLLAEAETAFKAKRFSKPVNNNAIARYRAVLALDAGNKQAKEGLKNVANSYLKLAKEAIKKQELDRAEKYISQASILKADARQLSKVEKQFDQAKTDQNEQLVEDEQADRIEKLLFKARANLKALRLHAPKNDNAVTNYRAVLALQGDNKLALAGLKSVVSEDLKLAQTAIEEQQFTRAEGLILQADSVLPKSSAVQSLRQQWLQAKNKAVVVKELAPESKPEPKAVEVIKQVAKIEEPKELKKVAGQIAIIVHPTNALSNISSGQLKKMYIGQKSKWASGGKIVVLNQSVNSSARARFYRAVLGAAPETTFKSAYYGSSTGQLPFIAKERGSDSSVKRFIRRNKKAIGYIYLSNVDDSVKTLKINGADVFSGNYLLR